MSRWAKVENGEPKEISPKEPLVVNDVQYTLDVFDLAEKNEAGWSLAELEKLGVYRINETTVPDGKDVISTSLEFNGSAVNRIDVYQDKTVRVPESVTMMQAKIVLHRAGILEQVEQMIAGIPNKEIQIAWEYSDSINRYSPQMLVVAEALSLTQQQIDEFFISAASVVPSAEVK